MYMHLCSDVIMIFNMTSDTAISNTHRTCRRYMFIKCNMHIYVCSTP